MAVTLPLPTVPLWTWHTCCRPGLTYHLLTATPTSVALPILVLCWDSKDKPDLVPSPQRMQSLGSPMHRNERDLEAGQRWGDAPLYSQACALSGSWDCHGNTFSEKRKCLGVLGRLSSEKRHSLRSGLRRGLPCILPQGNMTDGWTGQRSLLCPVWNDSCWSCWLLLPSAPFDSAAECAVASAPKDLQVPATLATC